MVIFLSSSQTASEITIKNTTAKLFKDINASINQYFVFKIRFLNINKYYIH